MSDDLFFDYDLPDDLIAQHPPARRDDSRLMVLQRDAGTIDHHHFRDLPGLLSADDLLVVNDSRVIPARMLGVREKTGAKWEALYLSTRADGSWECLAQTRSYPEVGETFLTPTGLRLKLAGRTDDRHWLLMPEIPGNEMARISAAELLATHGHIPLPPYIRDGLASDADHERYQTVYARNAGSVAAPTAGLHFTQELLEQLSAKGISTARVTLHVGLGTFLPVKAVNPAEHAIHAEWCEVTEETVAAIEQTRGRVIAVGTTTTRTLETAARQQPGRKLAAFIGPSDLYIRPPFEFQILGGLITNFHLPRTTLLLLTQAFASVELIRKAYHEAITQRYRFYSYGDAMLIL